MTIGERIKKCRKSKGMSQEDLAKLLNTTKQAIYKYESNIVTNIPVEKIEAMSKIFGVQPSYLTGWAPIGIPTITTVTKSKKPLGKRFRQSTVEEDQDAVVTYLEGEAAEELCKAMGWDYPTTISIKPQGVRIPVYGSVAAGIPIEAITDIEDYEEITEDLARTGKFAALKIKGDSMEPRFTAGDVVIVRLQEDVDSGDIAIVLVNGDEATCKKIKKTPEGVMLISTNPAYEPMFYSNKEIEDLPVRIWGKVVELRAKF